MKLLDWAPENKNKIKNNQVNITLNGEDIYKVDLTSPIFKKLIMTSIYGNYHHIIIDTIIKNITNNKFIIVDDQSLEQ